MHHAAAQHRVGLRRLSRHAHGLILALLVGLTLASPASAQDLCGQTLTQSTTLAEDLNCHDDSIFIGADGITLDLGGHSVWGVENYRIVNDGHDEVTIRNGTVGGDQGAIHLIGATGNVVRDIHARGLILGIYAERSDDNRFVDNHADSVTFDVSGSRNAIAHNLVSQYESRLSVVGDYNRVVDNVVWGGFLGSSFSLGGDHNAVRRNVFVNNDLFVVYLTNASDTIFAANTIGSDDRGRNPGGAQIKTSSRNRFVDNKLFGVAQGFDLQSGADNVFRRNDVSGAPLEGPDYIPLVPDGIAVAAGVTGTVLRDNTVHGFDDDGFDVEAPGTRLKGNSATGNGDLGYELVPGVIDAGGNTASGNG